MDQQQAGNGDNAFRSPLPRPNFYDQFDMPLSTKREKMRCTPVRSKMSMPRAARTAPAISRTYPRRFALQKPHLISFKNVLSDDIQIRSPIYDENIGMSYFEQCFTCERKLGEGSFGEVFAVYSKEDGRRYAVKRALETFRNGSDRQIKLREVQKHELLPSHTNLVALVKAWEERGRLYIQTELCETSLLDYCSERHTVPEHEIWNFFLDLLMAVDHLHSHDLLHVDIKPDNILLTKDKICKLGDFGLIFDLQNDKLDTASEGDSKYLAAEVLNGTPTKAADIFSLGITILEIATDLDLPSRGEGWLQLRSGRVPERFFTPLSPDLRRLILWMLSPEASDRPTTKQLLMDSAIVSRMSHRTRQLHIHEVKSSVTYHLRTVWLWLLAIFWLFAGGCRWVFDALQKTKHEVCTTPYKGFNRGKSALFEQHTPETVYQHTMDEAQHYDNDLEWSFSDDEDRQAQQFQQQQIRHAHTVAVNRRRSQLFPTNSPIADPFPRYRLNFDLDEDTPTSSSDISDSPPTTVTPPLQEPNLLSSPQSAIAASSPSPSRSARRIFNSMTDGRKISDMGAGDCGLYGHFSDDSDDDGLEEHRPSLIAMTCPARVPLRTQIRHRGISRPIPRLNLDLLDTPDTDATTTASAASNASVRARETTPQPAPSMTMSERRRGLRPKGRMISARDSSAEE